MEHLSQDNWCEECKYKNLYQQVFVSKIFIAKGENLLRSGLQTAH